LTEWGPRTMPIAEAAGIPQPQPSNNMIHKSRREDKLICSYPREIVAAMGYGVAREC
jgi:hypothetical protein